MSSLREEVSGACRMINPSSNEELKELVIDGVLDCKGEDLKCGFDIDIEASIVNCRNINCRGDIDCWNIDCCDISYYAFVVAYQDIKCKSIQGRRDNSFHKCLDGELTIKTTEEPTKDYIIKDGKKYEVKIIREVERDS